MMYREYFVMRKALAWFACLSLALILFVFATSKSGSTLSLRHSIDYSEITNASAWFATIFASVFGVALGNGSRESARVLWVLPTQRWKLALQVIAVDLVGATLAFAFVYASVLVLAGLYSRVAAGTPNAVDITAALGMTYATYGWSTLVGMLGRRVAYSGLIALPALMIWMILSPSSGTIGTILRTPIAANPFAVYNAGQTLNGWSPHHFALDPITSSLQWLGTTWATPVLCATAIATCALAAFLWQRAQTISA